MLSQAVYAHEYQRRSWVSLCGPRAHHHISVIQQLASWSFGLLHLDISSVYTLSACERAPRAAQHNTAQHSTVELRFFHRRRTAVY